MASVHGDRGVEAKDMILRDLCRNTISSWRFARIIVEKMDTIIRGKTVVKLEILVKKLAPQKPKPPANERLVEEQQILCREKKNEKLD
eukprot:snap_masked-scaffold_5-processed-gene-10.17-mRNA-1 protein AED:1.00 eAED:1.00 QI:0/0/0/0/1/1/2/0/87